MLVDAAKREKSESETLCITFCDGHGCSVNSLCE